MRSPGAGYARAFGVPKSCRDAVNGPSRHHSSRSSETALLEARRGVPRVTMQDEPVLVVLAPDCNIGRGPGRRSFPGCSESPPARTEQSPLETMVVERWISRWLGLFRKPELLRRDRRDGVVNSSFGRAEKQIHENVLGSGQQQGAPFPVFGSGGER